jgi:hypothetical protein
MEARMTRLLRTRVATTLLTFVLPLEDVEAIIGDLEEEETSRAWGDAWYWAQVMRSVPAVLWLPTRRSGWLATWSVAVTACVVQIAIEVSTGLAIRRFAPLDAQWPPVVAIVVTLASLIGVSFEAARIRPGAATAFAGLAVCAITFQLAVAAQAGSSLPVGMLAALVVAPGTALAGGFLSSKARRR